MCTLGVLLVTMVNGMPYGYPPAFGPKSGGRYGLEESMLASHAALCLFTGSREMLVFHTSLAGNIGQLAAPGTVVAGDFAGAGAFVAVAVGAGVAVGAVAGVAVGFALLGPAVSVTP